VQLQAVSRAISNNSEYYKTATNRSAFAKKPRVILCYLRCYGSTYRFRFTVVTAVIEFLCSTTSWTLAMLIRQVARSAISLYNAVVVTSEEVY